MTHPHVLARGMALPAQGADMPPMVANPMLMDGQRMTAPLPPPLLGGDVAAWQS
jgi:crotonobetainyl-CoA:carnitine CoA-transferase CaiB-like acyl-CoA transferase